MTFDESRLPLVVIRIAGDLSTEGIHELERKIDALLDRHQPYALVWDMLDAKVPNRHNIMELLRWSKRSRLRAREEYALGPEPIPSYAAYVMRPTMVKVLLFLEQMTPQPDMPTGVFESVAEGIDAAEAMLERFGCPAPLRGSRE